MGPIAPLGAGFAIVLALNVYGLTGGADYGGGVWDLLAGGARARRQRELIAGSLGPIWEANHVWLIVAVVGLFTAFPPAFARISTFLHLPLLLLLLGVVARGAAFSFRAYDPGSGSGGTHGSGGGSAAGSWGRVFAVASLVTPLLLGVVLGAVASGRVSAVPPLGGSGPVPVPFVAFLTPWLGLFPLSVGLFALVLFAHLAAVYLTVEAVHQGEPDLAEDFRRRALLSGILLGPVAALVLLAARGRAPMLWHALTGGEAGVTGWAVALHLATAASACAALAALWRRRFHLARACAALQASLILWGWAWAQYPYVVVPDLTLAGAASPRATLVAFLAALAVGSVLLLPSFYYLLRVFGKLRRAPATGRP